MELAETVFTTLGKPDMDLEPWKVSKHSPSELQLQMNGYACGFFLIHAMGATGNGESLSSVTNDLTPKVRNDELDLLLENLSYDHLLPPKRKLIIMLP